jgi:hypothetical protein
MVSLTAADAASCGDLGAYRRAREQQDHAKGAKVKQWLHDFLSHPWLAAKAGCRRRPMAVRNAENGGPASLLGSAERNERPHGAASSSFDFVPGTSPSWSFKGYVF